MAAAALVLAILAGGWVWADAGTELRARFGDQDAQLELARFHAANAQPEQAEVWYRRAAAQGATGAARELSRLRDEDARVDGGTEPSPGPLPEIPRSRVGVTRDRAEPSQRVQGQRRSPRSRPGAAEEAPPRDSRVESPAADDPDATVAPDLGKAWALYEQGLEHYWSEGVSRNDYREAVRLFEAAAELGLADAQNMLASLYYWGAGVGVNHRETERLLRSAAEQGHVEAQLTLGTLLANGVRIPADPIEAYYWLTLANRAEEYGAANMLRRVEAGLSEPERRAAEVRLP